MTAPGECERVEVMRGGHKPGEPDLFGPLPGVRVGDAIMYEFELPEWIEPWPGLSRLERTFVLLDLGVSMANPCWQRAEFPEGNVAENPVTERHSWYVDLITVEREGDRYVFRDLFVDVRVPTDDERHYRLLDLDDLADAVENDAITVEQAVSGLRRWQRFLDRHLHDGGYPSAKWSDFPPAVFDPLRALDAPLAPPVLWEG
jgi:hypothetical protein